VRVVECEGICRDGWRVADDPVLSLSLAFAEAGFDGAPLRDALCRLAAATGADEALLYRRGPTAGWVDVHSVRAGEDVLAAYRREMLPYNPRGSVWSAMPPGVPIDLDRFVEPDAVEAGPLGAFMRRSGFPARHICGIRLDLGQGEEARLSLGRNTGGFDPRTLTLLGALAPHLVAVLRGRALLAATPVEPAGQAGGFGDIEVLPQPLGIVSGTPPMLNANAALRRLARRRDGLIMGHARLSAADPKADAALADAIATLPMLGSRGGTPMRSIAVPRAGDALPYLVQAIAIGGAAPHTRAVLLTVTAPSLGKPDAATLRDLLGLTRAEALLASELASGATLAGAALSRGISLETARTQLKAVLGKTGCARQQDLARLLARIGPGSDG
jgi:DNA-binding CsgD family transcriptional regulator